MKQLLVACIIVLVAALGAGGAGMGAGVASAATVPTLAVTTSGAADWQLTYDRGAAPSAARCVVRIGERVVTPPSSVRTMVVRGDAVRPGASPVRVRCGRSLSPRIWIHAPRSQVNDVATWLSNAGAGLLGH
ncbi:hypothetical protein [Gordonia sp. (in: high G+C Gram-positive bacteria)]|uniref:hypothetical protein n=1 Tax=Gordonia sp. (in: high G+C Gram-positive bacteria) TaxID=84139 RepID=UPI00352813BA